MVPVVTITNKGIFTLSRSEVTSAFKAPGAAEAFTGDGGMSKGGIPPPVVETSLATGCTALEGNFRAPSNQFDPLEKLAINAGPTNSDSSIARVLNLMFSIRYGIDDAKDDHDSWLSLKNNVKDFQKYRPDAVVPPFCIETINEVQTKTKKLLMLLLEI